MSQQNAQTEEPRSEIDTIVVSELLSSTTPPLDTPIETFPEQPNNHDDTESLMQQTLTSSGTMAITSTTPPIAMDINEDNIDESPNRSIQSLGNDDAGQSIDLNVAMDVSSTELIATPVSGESITDNTLCLISPTTPSVPKERRKRIIIDDDDESPTFNPLRSCIKVKGKNRRSRNTLLLKKQQKGQLLSPSNNTDESAVFTSPEGIVSVSFEFLK